MECITSSNVTTGCPPSLHFPKSKSGTRFSSVESGSEAAVPVHRGLAMRFMGRLRRGVKRSAELKHSDSLHPSLTNDTAAPTGDRVQHGVIGRVRKHFRLKRSSLLPSIPKPQEELARPKDQCTAKASPMGTPFAPSNNNEKLKESTQEQGW